MFWKKRKVREKANEYDETLTYLLEQVLYRVHKLEASIEEVITKRGVITLYDTSEVKEKLEERLNLARVEMYINMDAYTLAKDKYNKYLKNNCKNLNITKFYQPETLSCYDIVERSYKNYYKR